MRRGTARIRRVRRMAPSAAAVDPAMPQSRPFLAARLALFLLAALPFVASAGSDWLAISGQLAPAGTVDFTPHGTQPGLFLDMQAPDQCASCHSNNTDPAALAYRPYSTWAGSMMANATRDPLFWAALDVANKDAPGAGDFCLRCHTPRGWLDGRVVKEGFNPLPPPGTLEAGAAGCLLQGAYDSPDDINSDFSGLTCHFCHRLMPEGPNGEPGYTENGNFWIDDQPCGDAGEPCRHGPYDYTDGAPEPPHPWVYSQYHTESAICGNCHNVTSPDTSAGTFRTLKLADGTDTGLAFPIERTFAEWQQSQFAQAPETSCQSCHMPQAEDPNASACTFNQNRFGNLPVHAFVGGNTWIPSILNGQYAEGMEQGGPERSASFEQTIQWARELLGTAADVQTTIQSWTPPASGDGALGLRVKVTNNSGHKLPSGYGEGRRMWLNVQVKDANGGLVFESAAYDASSGVLSHDSQARVYEVLQGIFNHNGTGTCDVADGAGKAMFHFVLNDCIAKDNRIPPLGFRPATAADPNGYELRPVGADYPETSPGSGVLVNFDTVDYAIPVPVGTVGPLTATARLYYQTSSKEYIEFLRDEAVANGTEGENLMCEGAPDRPFTIGPQERTRGQYMYDLWSEPTPEDRLLGDGFDGVILPTGYGKSPPELIGTASVSTP